LACASKKPVAVRPGFNVHTAIGSRAHSIRSASPIEITAALLAAYAHWPGMPRLPTTDATSTTTGRALRRRSGSAARQHRSKPITFVSNSARSNSASSSSTRAR